MEHAPFAGFWRRALAAIIDLVLSIPFYYALGKIFGEHNWMTETIFMVVFSGMYIWLFASRWQGSPGMRLMGVVIIDNHGQRISLLRSFWWTVTSFVGMAIAFAGVIALDAKYNISKVNELLMAAQTGQMDGQEAVSQIEAMTGMPFIELYGLILLAFLVTVLLSIVWMLSVALSKQKSGFHNWICGTRMVLGRM